MIKHFLKTLLLFSIMIVLGLIGVYLINHYGNGVESINMQNNKTQIAK